MIVVDHIVHKIFDTTHEIIYSFAETCRK